MNNNNLETTVAAICSSRDADLRERNGADPGTAEAEGHPLPEQSPGHLEQPCAPIHRPALA